MDNTKTDYNKTKRIRFFLPWREGLKRALREYVLSAKNSINGHGLLLRLRETKIAMTAVFKRGIIPYHSHQESWPGVEQLRYKTSFNCTISADQLSATILDISTRIIIITCDVEDQLFILNCQTVVLNSRDTSFSFLRLHNSMRT